MQALLLTVLVATGAFAGLCYLGLPVRKLIGARSADPFGLQAAITGLAVLTTFSWYWVSVRDDGLDVGLPVLLGLGLAPFLWAAQKPRTTVRAVLLRIGSFALLGAGVTAVFWFYMGDAFGYSVPVPVSLGNNDPASYALAAQHLQKEGFADTGHIVGADLGAIAKLDVFGAFALLALISQAFGLSISTVFTPALLLGTFLCAAGVATVCATVATLRVVPAVSVAVAACASPYFFYSVGHGFLAQFYAMAAVFALLAVLVHGLLATPERLTPTWRTGARAAAAYAPGFVGLLMVYPHMAFLAVPPLAAVPLLALAWSGCWAAARAATLHIIAVVWALTVAALLLLPRTIIAVQRTRELTEPAGWTLEPLGLRQLFGVAPFPDQPARPPGIIPPLAERVEALATATVGIGLLGVLLLLVYVGLLIRRLPNRHRLTCALSATLVAVPLLTYGVFLARYGDGYQHWKWMSFWQPIAVGGALLLVVLTAQWLSGRTWQPMRSSLWAALPAELMLVLMLAAANGETTAHAQRVDQSLLSLPARAADLPDGSLNVRIDSPSPYWNTMWAAFFLADRELHLVSPSYYAATEDPAAPTLLQSPPTADFQLLVPEQRAQVGPPTSADK
jgi:hypothetical protein